MMTTDYRSQAEKDAARRFASETAKHEMTVQYDSGLNRTLKFSNPGSSLYWYEITTTPGQLVFSGDGDSFVFRLGEDMFKLFRRSYENGDLNVGYWAEKCRTGNAKSYSRDRFEQCVWKQVDDAEAYYRNLREDVQAQIFESELFDVDYESAALMAVLGYTCHLTLRRDADGNRVPFRFRYVHEWDLQDYDWWFLFACHAIRHGIAQYDAVKDAPKAVTS